MIIVMIMMIVIGIILIVMTVKLAMVMITVMIMMIAIRTLLTVMMMIAARIMIIKRGNKKTTNLARDAPGPNRMQISQNFTNYFLVCTKFGTFRVCIQSKLLVNAERFISQNLSYFGCLHSWRNIHT